ncbi:MAG: response regulator [Elusimicrobia bacterium]|nr:response regulator [Elusimicrobiota bacterium]
MADILVVDDEQEILSLLRFLLEREGHRVTEAANGQDALRLLGIEPPNPAAALPDLMILDIMMPVMDGYTLNTRLQDHPATRRLPIIVLTAKGQRMRDLFQSSANVAAYVQKPFDPKILRDLISSVVNRAQKPVP